MTTDRQNPKDQVTRLQHSTPSYYHCSETQLQYWLIGTVALRLKCDWIKVDFKAVCAVNNVWKCDEVNKYHVLPLSSKEYYSVFVCECVCTCACIRNCVCLCVCVFVFLFMRSCVHAPPCEHVFVWSLRRWGAERRTLHPSLSKQLMEVQGRSSVSVTDAVLSSEGELADFAQF